MSSVDLKTSILVNRQVPEFVRDEYPTFVAFLEAYYQFLEGTANTGKTANNLVTTAKSLRDIRDVDTSLNEFETNFYNTYATLIPLEVQADKALLFKHLVPLYKAKGSDASFKLLFQLIFGVDIDLVLPKNNVLKASSSNWQIDNKLRINQDVASVYVGDGVLKTFNLAQIVGKDEISVYVNGVAHTNFFVNKEYRKLNFVTAPANNSDIRVVYDNFNTELLNNRKVIGLKSGASAIIEQANRRIISDTLNLGLPIELLINTQSLDKDFLNGEFVSIPIIDPDNPYGNTINIEVSTFSIVKKFNIIDGGFNYKIGDSVLVTGGNATVNAIGTVSSVFKGLIESVEVSRGGAVFSNLSPVAVSGNGAVALTIVVDGIDQTGVNAANSFIVSTDVVLPYSSTVLSSANYAFANSIAVTSPNINTRIVDVIGFQTLSVGPITNVKILLTSGSTGNTPSLDAFGAPFGDLGSLRSPKSLRSVGRFKINNPGSGYVIGDEVVFGANPPGTYGHSAAATVSNVSSSGAIITLETANTRIIGTATVTATSASVVGSGTQFLTDLRVGDKIDVNNESRIVSSISDDTNALVTSPFTYSASGKKIGVFGRHPKGGINYTQNSFPSVTVTSAGGVGANVEIDALVSDGEIIFPTGIGQPGEILSIQVLDPGSGYEYIPIITISGGSGTGTANAEIERSYLSSPGRWTTSDSILSSTERKLAGQDYYVDYSYVISSQIEFYRYKKILKELLHPVGFVNYSEFNKTNTVELADVNVSTINVATDNQFLTVSGKVNVGNGSIVVTGTNTKFNAAVSRGAFTAGSRVAVNGEIRTVNSVVSNTSLIVSSNVNDIWIANPGSGYSNGNLIFSGGGGRITSLTITNTGSGYESGNVVFSGVDEAIPAVATVVANATGHLQSVTLVDEGLYSGLPIALPASTPHKVLYANSITITNPGAGYTSGTLSFIGGVPIRDAVASFTVDGSGGITGITVTDSGLYETNPVAAAPSTAQSVVIFGVTTSSYGSVTPRGNGHSNGVLTFSGGTPTRAAVVRVETYPPNSLNVRTITANAGAWVSNGNGYISFTNSNQIIPANARVYVNSTGFIVNVTVLSSGLYTGLPTAYIPATNTQISGTVTVTAASTSVVGAGTNFQSELLVGDKININGESRHISSITSNVSLSVTSPFTYSTFASGGGATGSGNTAYRNLSNAVFTISPNLLDGTIRNITIVDSGLYATPPTAVLNTGPISVSAVVSNTAPDFTYGRFASNGYVIFTGGDPLINASATVEVYPSNGSIRKITVNEVGLYRTAPSVTINSSPVSITEVLPILGGTGYANGYIVFEGGGANSNAYVSVNVNSTGSIVRTVIFDQGIYTGNSPITIKTLNSFVTGLPQGGSGATFAITVNSNTTNVPVLSSTTTANTLYQTTVSITANSNSVTNATFTMSGVSNTETVAVIDVGFTGTNTAAQSSIEVYPSNGAIRRVNISSNGEYFYAPTVTPNSGGAGAVIRVNSVGTFSQTANGQEMIVWK